MAGGAFGCEGDRKWRHRRSGWRRSHPAAELPRSSRRPNRAFLAGGARPRPALPALGQPQGFSPAGGLPAAGSAPRSRRSSPRTRRASPVRVIRCWMRRHRCPRLSPQAKGFSRGTCGRQGFSSAALGSLIPVRQTANAHLGGQHGPFVAEAR